MKLPRFIFSNKWPYRLARHAAFWLARISFLLFAMVGRGGLTGLSFSISILPNLVQFAVLIILIADMPFCYITIYFLTPRYLLKKKYFLFVLNLFLSILLVKPLADLLLFRAFGFSTEASPDYYLFFWKSFIDFFSDGCVSACTVFLCLKLFKTWYLKHAEGQILMRANAEAEMQLLKAQVQPHFLFNTLNNIYSFTLNKSSKAKELVDNLNNIMNYMVNDCKVELIELTKDLKMIQDYIELEKVRYGKRLDIIVNIEGENKNKMVTPLLMIPFIENSFKHGASKMLKDPWIKLFIQADEDVLHFTLNNNKQPEKKVIAKKQGIGLANVKKRLALLYPKNHLLLIESTENTFTVNMQIPLKKITQEIIA